jgi:phage regulator Rha-like protein
MKTDTPPKEKPTGSENYPAGHTDSQIVAKPADTGNGFSSLAEATVKSTGGQAVSAATASDPVQTREVGFALTTAKNESRVDSRLLASHLGNQHRHVMALIEKYAVRFEGFSQLLFKNAVGARQQGGGNPERYALLNENQAYFLLALSRNSARVVDLKAKLIQAFSEARRADHQQQAEYLPTYRRLHEVVHSLTNASSHGKFVHMNVNKLVNKAAGVEAGQRSSLALPQQSLLIVAQALAAQAMQGAADHHAGYERAKQSLLALSEAVNMQNLGFCHGGS